MRRHPRPSDKPPRHGTESPATPAAAEEEFPTSLQGGEPREHSDHRVGETQRQNPRVDTVDPAPNEPPPEDTQRR